MVAVRCIRYATPVAVALLATWCGATVARAQSAGPVRVTVRSETGLPLVGAQLRSVAADPLVETDEVGRATLPRVAAGSAWVLVRRIGYRPDSLRVSLVPGKSIDTTVTMQRVAVDLTPVRVYGRRDVQGPMAGFYARQAKGSGHFFSHADIERKAVHRFSDLMRTIPGVRIDSRDSKENIRIRGSRCPPLVWLDGNPLIGHEIDLDGLDVTSFDGVEVYTTASVPLEFTGNLALSSSCGTIVLWSLHGESTDNGNARKKGELSPAARIAQMLDEQKVFAPTDVDVVARIDSFTMVRPEYPDSLYDAQAPGRLVAEFVVGSNGIVQIDTYNPVTFTNRLLIEPVRRALRTQHFIPAVRKGQSVKQVMQLPFDFVPDSTARRKKP